MVSQDVLKWSVPVTLDPSEVLALPAAARDVVRAKPGVTPKVFVMNPALTESYGQFDHPELKGKNWNAIFKEAKEGVKSAKTAGSFIPAGEVVTIADSTIEKWQSAAGSTIEAKLVAVEDQTTFVFETASGKVIRTTGDKLSEESVQRAQKLAEQ